MRQATAHVAPVHGAAVDLERTVLVHRNELNEQQRPGQLVLVPLKQARGCPPRWNAKLLRNMKSEEDGATINAVEGLLGYTGADIERGNLDPRGLIPIHLKTSCVLFITNEVHKADSGRGMVSGMKGTPVEVGADGSLIDVRTGAVLRGGREDLAARCTVGDDVVARDHVGKWYDARVVDVRGEGAERKIKVHFSGWSRRFDEWVGGGRVREVGSVDDAAANDDEDSAEEHHELAGPSRGSGVSGRAGSPTGPRCGLGRAGAGRPVRTSHAGGAWDTRDPPVRRQRSLVDRHVRPRRLIKKSVNNQ